VRRCGTVAGLVPTRVKDPNGATHDLTSTGRQLLGLNFR